MTQKTTKKQTPIKVWVFELMKQVCPNCGKRDTKGMVRGAYEYRYAKKRLINHFCDNCSGSHLYAMMRAGEREMKRLVVIEGQGLDQRMLDWNRRRENRQYGDPLIDKMNLSHTDDMEPEDYPHECTKCGAYSYHATDCEFTGLVLEGQ